MGSSLIVEEKAQFSGRMSQGALKRIRYAIGLRIEAASIPFTDKRYITAGVALLTLICALRMYWTWATWGDVSIDCGRELYVPAVLRQGQMLYRDVWYHYGPAAPYFNSVLFRIFGMHMAVAYFAGALAALGSGIFLFLTGVELAFPWAGWTAGAAVVIEAFEPGLFSFPWPYSFASVYGCLISCALLWLLVQGMERGGWAWMGAAGLLAASALLLKLEFGAAAYAGVGLTMLLRWLATRDGKRLARDIAVVLPGVAVCYMVIGWMVSIRGPSFITQENIMSWPTSFFMKAYGKQWLAHTGLALNGTAFLETLKHTILVAGMLLAIRELLFARERGRRGILLLILLISGLVAYSRFLLWNLQPLWTAQATFFPRAMVLYTTLGGGIAVWYFVRQTRDVQAARFVLLLMFSSLLAARLMLNMQPDGYPIFYNGPVILGYLLLLSVALAGHGQKRQTRMVAVVLAGCVSVVALRAGYLSRHWPPVVPLETVYGTLRVPQRTAENYRAAIAFIREKTARNEAVLVVPEDTSLYFLSETHAPTRVYAFTPGIVAPGKMTDELFREIEAKNIRYLLWSNRTFMEYGAPIFGRDFNQELALFFTQHYKPVGLLVPGGEKRWGLTFTVWEREDRK